MGCLGSSFLRRTRFSHQPLGACRGNERVNTSTACCFHTVSRPRQREPRGWLNLILPGLGGGTWSLVIRSNVGTGVLLSLGVWSDYIGLGRLCQVECVGDSNCRLCVHFRASLPFKSRKRRKQSLDFRHPDAGSFQQQVIDSLDRPHLLLHHGHRLGAHTKLLWPLRQRDDNAQ